MILSKFNGSVKLKTINVPVPNVKKDAEVIVRQFSIADAVKFQNLMAKEFEKDGEPDTGRIIIAKLVCCMVDNTGNYIADENEIDVLMSNLDSDTVTALYEACNVLNPPPKLDMIDEKKS